MHCKLKSCSENIVSIKISMGKIRSYDFLIPTAFFSS